MGERYHSEKAQGIKSFSAMATAANSPIPMKARMNMQAKARAVCSWGDAERIRYPNPTSDPTNSAITAPTTDRVIAVFRELKK